MLKTIKVLLLGAIFALAYDTNKRVRNISTNNNLKFKNMSKELDVLSQQVHETKNVEESAVVLLQGLKARLDEAGTDKAKLSKLSDDLANGAFKLAAAIIANTPATDGAGTGTDAGAGTGDGSGTQS